MRSVRLAAPKSYTPGVEKGSAVSIPAASSPPSASPPSASLPRHLRRKHPCRVIPAVSIPAASSPPSASLPAVSIPAASSPPSASLPQGLRRQHPRRVCARVRLRPRVRARVHARVRGYVRACGMRAYLARAGALVRAVCPTLRSGPRHTHLDSGYARMRVPWVRAYPPKRCVWAPVRGFPAGDSDSGRRG
jgi:hypothetical protein